MKNTVLPILVLFMLCKSAKTEDIPVIVKEGEITQGALRTKTTEGEVVELPLKHTDVEVEISGFIVDAKVTQVFVNTFKNPIEATYVFPLPQNGAVYDMTMIVGKKKITSKIMEREKAKNIYEQAKKQGKRTALLEQERPNIFTQSVANIMPGDTIKIEIRYFAPLKYDRGEYEFVFPMVVGPRYIPGEGIGKKGTGWAEDTDRVPDASRITPPVLKPQKRPGYNISLKVKINAGVKIKDIKVISHDVNIKRISENTVEVSLKNKDEIPNKDFILRYKTAGKKLEYALLTHKEGKEGYFLLIIQPKAEYRMNEIIPKEMFFVVDNSGSMTGFPIEKAKDVMRKLIKGMNPEDKFQIISFSNTMEKFKPSPVGYTKENISEAMKFIDGFSGNGGTEMIPPIRYSLTYPHDAHRLRIVVLLTDGYIGYEREVFSLIRMYRKKARCFAIGIGSSPNRYLIERIAEEGKGIAYFIRQDETAEKVINDFYERISKPVLSDIELEFKGIEVFESYPQEPPDLFASQPLYIFGKYRGEGKAELLIKGNLRKKKYTQRITLYFPSHESKNKGIKKMWARNRIKKLESTLYSMHDDTIIKDIINTSIEYRVLSNYTAFVAVEEKVVRKNGKIEKIVVPVPIPEGVSYEGIFEKRAVPFMGSSAPTALKTTQCFEETATPKRKLTPTVTTQINTEPDWKITMIYGGLKEKDIKEVIKTAVKKLKNIVKTHPSELSIALMVKEDGTIEKVILIENTTEIEDERMARLFKTLKFKKSKEKTKIVIEIKM